MLSIALVSGVVPGALVRAGGLPSGTLPALTITLSFQTSKFGAFAQALPGPQIPDLISIIGRPMLGVNSLALTNVRPINEA